MAEQQNRGFQLSEDWLAVVVAFALIVLAAIGVLGEGGLNITF